ncbi:MAG: sigma-70 family RNA polymerase sigma factor [Firmicutes bacterium]|nr:sigma-70 family RNA polymerase sigma factor [Bacillota bacterium]MBQ6809905.1 sigma-70 family RNA polymerase sigma factor [Bacillota bacterium]
MKENCSYRDLSETEQKILWKNFSKGDEKSRQDLIQLNYPLVQAVASRFAFDRSRLDDLFQGGMVGLLDAMARFDPQRGVPFGVYAFPFIKGEVLKCLNEMKGEKKSSFCALERDKPLKEAIKNTSLSLEEWMEKGESLAFADLHAEEMFDTVEDRLALHDAVARLNREEQRLLYCRYVLKKSQVETGKELSLSQTRISRKEQEILAKLRGML